MCAECGGGQRKECDFDQRSACRPSSDFLGLVCQDELENNALASYVGLVG